MIRSTIATAGFALAGLGLAPGPARAQGCAGYPGTDLALVRVAASAASYTYASAVGVSVTAGRVVYGTLSYRRIRDPELDATSRERVVELGVDLKVLGRAYVCPLFAFSDADGPGNLALTGTNFRFATQEYGLGAGMPIRLSARWSVSASAEYRSILLTSTRSNPSTLITRRSQDVYQLWSGGVAVTFDGQLTLRVGASTPVGFTLVADGPQELSSAFGREERELSWNFALGWSFFR